MHESESDFFFNALSKVKNLIQKQFLNKLVSNFYLKKIQSDSIRLKKKVENLIFNLKIQFSGENGQGFFVLNFFWLAWLSYGSKNPVGPVILPKKDTPHYPLTLPLDWNNIY